MVEELANWLTSLMSGLPEELIIFVISMIPILELRGGIIAASLLGVPITTAIPVCIIGNIVPIPFILLFITKIFELMKKTKTFRPLVEKLESKAMGKSDTIKKYEFWGLMIFVGIPLPGTGAWTGSLIAALLRIKNKKAVPAIFLGLILETIIMCVVSYFIPWLIKMV
ncbi:MAG: small multi-drug export protein [Clostridia bacterium]|nr:small multi-drug export protein [Clostridia bacterium]